MLRLTAKNFNLINLLRVLAYPIVKLVPSLRTTIIVIAQKIEETHIKKKIVRWG